MSAYGIGSEAATTDGATRTNNSTTNVPQTIIKWIPGEAITFYAAVLGVGSAQGALTGDETPDELLQRIDAGSAAWFALGAFVAIALVVLGAYSAPRDDPEKRRSLSGIVVRCVLALLAFALWTSALPGSWPYSWNAIRDMGPAYALLLVPVGLIFAAAAEAVTRRVRL